MYNTNIKEENNKEHFQIILEKIRQERRNRIVIVLTVFGDESYDGKKQRVYAVSGLSGTQQEWDDIKKKWLDRTGGIPFHATDCEAGWGVYKNNSKEENEKLLVDMTKIIANSTVLGYVAVLDLVAQRKYFPGKLKNSAYYFCFSSVVQYFAKKSGLYFPPEKKVKFIFDRNMLTEPATPSLYEAMSLSSKSIKAYASLDSLEFAKSDNDENGFGIQAADLIAREAMKHDDNIILGRYKYPVRREMQILMATNRFSFSHYGEDYLKAYLNDLYKLKIKLDSYYDNYTQWLKDNKLQNNDLNRHKYLIYCRTAEKALI